MVMIKRRERWMGVKEKKNNHKEKKKKRRKKRGREK
jgi:hypothetical protein